MKIKAILTGATGMVGEGVLHECLNDPDVEQVLSISRKPYGLSHPKLREIVHSDFHDLSAIQDQFKGYNACFFCLGVSSVGMKEPEYRRITFDLTMHVAQAVLYHNPDLTFCFVSGSGTDGTGKGKLMWARVKGQTENALLQMPFKQAYMFRPGFMQPTKGLKNTLSAYNYLSWLYPVMRPLFPKYVSTLQEMGLSMINAVRYGYSKRVLEVPDIVTLAKAGVSA
jgi:uncharacterized protein YbjT (DUF2867 family)